MPPVEEEENSQQPVRSEAKWSPSMTVKVLAIVVPAITTATGAWWKSRSDLAAAYDGLAETVDQQSKAVQELDKKIDELNTVVAYQQGLLRAPLTPQPIGIDESGGSGRRRPTPNRRSGLGGGPERPTPPPPTAELPPRPLAGGSGPVSPLPEAGGPADAKTRAAIKAVTGDQSPRRAAKLNPLPGTLREMLDVRQRRSVRAPSTPDK